MFTFKSVFFLGIVVVSDKVPYCVNYSECGEQQHMPHETCIIVHILLQTPCRSWPCQNNGKCLPVYEKNDYECICEGFRGKNCEKGKKYSKNTVPHLS